MPGEEKPYRVYRGGRVKGKVPSAADRPARTLPGRFGRGGGSGDGGSPPRTDYRGPGGGARRKPRWGRRIALGIVVLLVLFVVWAVASWLSFSSGVSDANKALDPNAKLALTKQSGLLLSHSTTVLLLGTDNGEVGRAGDRHSDSMMLMRTDPSHHRIYYLSIPRDIVVPIPGASAQKINAAMQIGGPALAIRTVHDFTGLPINHVVVVNFAEFKDLIDALGGITIDVPAPIRSNRFACPYSTQARCDKWQGWRYAKGKQHMNGQRALVYSRIRENALNPADSDITRGARQQAVMDATLARLTSPGVLISLPWDGGNIVKPLTTDMSASQLAEFGWARFRASSGSAVHCRLGGDLGGGGTGQPSEDNPATIAMFLGKSAPQPPTDAYGPGCVVGHPLQ